MCDVYPVFNLLLLEKGPSKGYANGRSNGYSEPTHEDKPGYAFPTSQTYNGLDPYDTRPAKPTQAARDDLSYNREVPSYERRASPLAKGLYREPIAPHATRGPAPMEQEPAPYADYQSYNNQEPRSYREQKPRIYDAPEPRAYNAHEPRGYGEQETKGYNADPVPAPYLNADKEQM